MALLFVFVGCGVPTTNTPEQTPAVEGTERVVELGRNDCDGSVERFAWAEGEATFLCICTAPDTCRISNQSCPGVSGSPLDGDTGLWCCTECEGIVDGTVEYQICT